MILLIGRLNQGNRRPLAEAWMKSSFWSVVLSPQNKAPVEWLYRRSFWAGGFGTHACGDKVPCLTAWRQPSIRKANSCEFAFPLSNGVASGVRTHDLRSTIWRVDQLRYSHHMVRPEGLEPRPTA